MFLYAQDQPASARFLLHRPFIVNCNYQQRVEGWLQKATTLLGFSRCEGAGLLFEGFRQPEWSRHVVLRHTNRDVAGYSPLESSWKMHASGGGDRYALDRHLCFVDQTDVGSAFFRLGHFWSAYGNLDRVYV